MDVFYEESSIAKNERRGKTKYQIFKILSNIFLVIGILGIAFIFYVPLDGIFLWLFICAWFFIFNSFNSSIHFSISLFFFENL